MSDRAAAEKSAIHGYKPLRLPRRATAAERSARDVSSSIDLLQAHAGNRAVSQLLGCGTPLPDRLRAEMELRFGTCFDNVRVHDDPVAHAVAAAMSAKALTRGSDVVFGEGRFAPALPEGKRLLAHELAHVIQQRRGGGAPPWKRDASNEVAADRAAAAVARGNGPVAVEGASSIGVARAEADGPSAADDATTAMLNRFRRAMLDALLAGAGYVGPGTVLLAKANEGFSDRAFQELWREGKGMDLLKNFLSLGFGGVAQAALAYQAGVVEGVISPVTDAVRSLFGVGVLVESGRNLAWSLLKSAYNASGEIGPEIEKLLADSNALAASARESLTALANDPEAIKWLLSLPEAAEKAVQQKAYELGAAGASKVIATLESPWPKEQSEPEPEPELGLSTLASYTYSKAGSALGAVHDYFISSPGAKIGESIGYAVGVAAVQVLLLVTTAGTAGVVEGIGAALAKVGALLARFSSTAGRAVGGAAELVGLLGGAIRTVESASAEVLGAMKEGLAKVFKPVVEKLKEWFGSALAVLKKALGIVEKEAEALPAPSPAHVSPKVTSSAHADDWDADEPTELKIAPVRQQPDREPGTGPGLRKRPVDDTWDPDADTPGSTTFVPEDDAPASTTFVPEESAESTPRPRYTVESKAGSSIGPDEPTELRIAPVREDPDWKPGPGLPKRSVDDTWDPDADTPGSTTFVPEDEAPASTTFVPEDSGGPTPRPAAGPTLVPAETEAELKGLKVFRDADEPDAGSFLKSPDEIDVPEPAEAPGSTLVPAPEEAPRLASPRQEKKLIEAPTPDTSQVPLLDPEKKLQPAFVLDDPARERIAGEIGPEGFRPDPVPGEVAPALELAGPTPKPTGPTLVPDTGPTIVPMEETGKVFVDVPEEPRPEGFVKWGTKEPEVRPVEIIEPKDEPTVEMTAKEMKRIRAEAQMRAAQDAAKTGADWPKVVPHQELAPPPKVRKKKRRS